MHAGADRRNLARYDHARKLGHYSAPDNDPHSKQHRSCTVRRVAANAHVRRWSRTYNVTWTIPAFDVNGGHIALAHRAPLASGETQQVGVAFSGGGWGAQPATAV